MRLSLPWVPPAAYGVCTVDLGAAIGDFAVDRKLWVGGMMRIVTVALLAASAGLLLTDAGAQAQTAPGVRAAQVAPTDASAQRRALRRVPIYPRDGWEPDVYPRYNPGPSAVRVCNAHYVQEYRPSGTVITPRMHCYWRPG
jgi:hypothetical protein